MTIMVTLASSPEWQNVLTQQLLPVVSELQLEQLLCADTTEPADSAAKSNAAYLVSQPLTLTQLQQALQHPSKVHIVAAYLPAEFAIANALLAGATPAAAVQTELKHLQDLLSLQRQHRRQLSLLNLRLLPSQPLSAEAAQASPLQPLGLAALVMDAPLLSNNCQAQRFAVLTASQLLAQSTELQALLVQLEGCSLPISEQPAVDLSLPEFWQHYIAEQQQLDAFKAQAAQEHEALSQQLAQLTAENSRLKSNEENLNKQLNSLTALNNNTQTEQAKTQTALANAQSENELLLTQLLQVQEELEKHYLSAEQLKQTELGLVSKNAELTEQVNQGKLKYNSLEDHLTKAQQAEAATKTELAKLQQQIPQLQQQLTAVNEKLQQATTLAAEQKAQRLLAEQQSASLSNKLSKAEQQLKQLQQEAGKQFQQSQADMATLTSQLTQLQADKAQLADKALALTTAQKDLAAAKAQQAELTAENELLLTQLLQVQEELEKYYLQHQQLQQTASAQTKQQADKIAELEGIRRKRNLEVTKLKAEIANLNANLAQLATVNDDNSLLLQQIANLQQELEHYYKKQQALNVEVAELQQQRNQAQQALRANQANSATLQQQLEQQFETSLQQQNAVAAVQAELNGQLANTQQQLQRLQTQLTTTQQRLVQVEQEKQRQNTLHIQQQKQQQRELSKLEISFKQQRAAAAGLTHQNQILQGQLKTIQQSVSWKAAAPVRVLARAVKKTDKAKQKLQQEVGLLFTSEFFDADWYLTSYPDVKESGANPAEHYLKFGAAEGRRPSADFDGNWYLQRYPDVASTGVNPLLHYIKFGRNEGRTASPKLLEDHSEKQKG